MEENNRKVIILVNRSKPFRLLALQGSFAYEVQIGQHVFQWFYQPFQGKRFHHWVSQF